LRRVPSPPTSTSISGGGSATVFQGDLTLQVGASAAAPRPFDVAIPLTTPFAFDGAGGHNLLLDIRITGCADATALDFATASPSVSRALAANAQAATASSINLGAGLVTQFLMGGQPCQSNATTLCIDDRVGDRRFRVRVSYQTTQGGGLAGEGRAIPLAALRQRRGGLF
jgi:hypothetical protein